MKKLITSAFVLLTVVAASAQYVCTDKGTEFTLKTNATTPEGEAIETVTSCTIEDVTTAPDGVITVKVAEQTALPTGFGVITEYSTTTYNPNDGVTTVILADPEQTKASVMDMIKMSAEAAGQTVSISDIEGMIRASGELKLELKADIAEGTKIPNQTIRVNIATETMKMNIWEGQFLGTEQITVPAGTFDCLKVSYVENNQMGNNREKKNVTSWYAPGIGLVRTVSTDKKGNELSKTELTEIKKH